MTCSFKSFVTLLSPRPHFLPNPKEMSSEDIFQAEPSAGATSTPSAFRRMTNKLLPTSSPMTPEHAPRRPRPPAAREPVPQSNDSSPSYSPSGPPLTQDPLSNMDVTASVVQQLRHASRRNATLEAARAETAEKIRLLEEEILKMTGKNDRLTNENRELKGKGGSCEHSS